MPHPYQCLYYCQQPSQSESDVLVAASGSCIYTFSAQNGRYLSTWPSHNEIEQTQPVSHKSENKPETPHLKSPAQNGSERPTKRQKTSLARQESSSSSAEIVVAADIYDYELSNPQQPSKPPIIKLAGTSNGRQLVAVTGEDKCIRVFDLAADGTLTQLSERSMPKKPCAIALTPDDSTILCADKFGDVYSLPLMGQALGPEAVNGANTSSTSGTINHKQKQKPFAPSATSLTVHTKRNRDALRHQQNSKNIKAEKRALNFDQKLLLGHVSLLTDIACVTLASPSYKPRNYILTSDRDEHIRISRGTPQAHIIDGYCLGHTEFITKLCVPPVYPHLLISGGGDDYLILWDWPAGKMLQRFDLKSLVATIKDTHFTAGKSINSSAEINDTETEADSVLRICVSSIQALEIYPGPSGNPRVAIIVTCEGVPALFTFNLGEREKIQFNASIRTECNVIDLTVLRNQSSIVYSMDSSHQAFSTDVLVDAENMNSRSLVGSLSYCTDSVTWKVNESLQANLAAAMRDCVDSNLNVLQAGAGKGRSLTELLYGLGSLRKRGSENELEV